MPITVQHGGQGGTTAGQIIAQAGQARLNREQQESQLLLQLTNQRQMQMMQIGAQADLQRQAADDAYARTALQFGLQDKLQENELDRNIKLAQEQAKVEASKFDYQFTARQRQEIAKFNNARQQIKSSQTLAPAEKEAALRNIDLRQSEISPQAVPSSGFKWPELGGKPTGPGIITRDPETGALITGGMDANGNPTFKLIQRWDQGPEAAQQKAQQEAAEKQQAAKEKFRLDLITKETSDPLTGETKFLDPATVMERYELAFPEEKAKSNKIKLDNAVTYIKRAKAKYGNNPPQEVLDAMIQAAQTIKQSKQ